MHKLHLTAVLALFLVSPLASAIGIDSCVRLNQSGSYQLISDIETSTGACITIDNNSITLDCNYYSIRTTGTSHPAILVSALKENITITHCNISTTGYNSPGIYPLEYSNLNITYNTINTNDSNSAGILLYRSQFDNITGNIINTAGDASYGIYVYNYSNHNILAGNRITTSGNGSYAIFIYYSTNNSLSGNEMNASNSTGLYVTGGESSEYNHNIDQLNKVWGKKVIYYYNGNTEVVTNEVAGHVEFEYSTNMYLYYSNVSDDGIILRNTHHSTLGYNNVTTNLSAVPGIYLINSSNNTIRENRINTSGSEGFGVYLYTRSDDNTVRDNTINTTGADAYGIKLRTSSGNTVRNNTINTTGEYAYGVLLFSSANSNTLSNNTIRTRGYYAIGFDLSNSARYNTLSNNNINTTGEGAYGIYVFSYANNNNLTGNTINTSGSTAYGIRLEYSSNSNLISNTINTTGNGALGVHIYQNSISNNLTSNTIYTSNQNAFGVEIRSNANNNALTGNTIRTSNTGSHGVLALDCVNNTLMSNTLNTIGDGANGVWIQNSSGNSLTENTVRTAGGGNSDGIWLYLSSNNNLSGNNINTTGAAARGIWLDNSSGNRLTENTLRTTGGSSAGYGSNGIFLSSASDTNNLTGNTINTEGESAHGIYVRSSSNNNKFVDNTIQATGTYAHALSIYASLNNNFTGDSFTATAASANAVNLEDSQGSVFANASMSSAASNKDVRSAFSSASTLLNCTFNNAKLGFSDDTSRLTIQWYFRVYTKNETSLPIPDVLVAVTNASGAGNPMYTEFTDAGGRTTWRAVTERVQTALENTSYTPHNVTANISGYDIGIAQTTINRSKEEVITLYPPGHGPWYGVRLNSPENGTVDYDGNVMLVYTPTSPTAIPNCSLYSNLSGAFAYGWSDDTIHNDTTNSFAVIGAASGNYMWNVLCIINATPMFALENRTFTVNKTNNNSVVQNITTTANVPFEVNATNLNASVSITTSASVGDADMRVIVSLHDNTTRNTTIGVPGLNKIISIDASSEIANNLASAMLRLNYTHAEVAAAGLNETDMALWRYNETTHQWTALTNNTPGVYGTGVNTAADYVWANVSHFSDYAIAQASQTQQTTMTAGWNLISIPLII